ncbi:MAG: hypothetical protein GC162_01085 [Planctomycetes bacterium]|nr:hypothetical protein [Planctomycetota bacterium]
MKRETGAGEVVEGERVSREAAEAWTGKRLEPCPRCHALREAGMVVCTACGFDVRTGRSAPRENEVLAEQRRAATASDRAANKFRDFTAPALLLMLATLIELAVLFDPVRLLIDLTGGTVLMIMGAAAISRVVGVEFSPTDSAALKLCAMGMATAVGRDVALHWLAPAMPSGGFISAALGSIAALAPLAMALLIIPAVMLALMSRWFFQTDPHETMASTAVFLFVQTVLFAILIST